jgi:hypothetical protein
MYFCEMKLLILVLRLVTDGTTTSTPDPDDFLTLASSTRHPSGTPTVKTDIYGQCQSFSIPPSPLFAPSYNQYATNSSGLDIAQFCIWHGQEGAAVAEHVYTQRVINEDVFNGRVGIDSLPDWTTRYPHLAECIERECPVQGGVLLVKSRLTLPALNQVLDANTLKTHLAVTVQDPYVSDLSAVTRIYTMGQKVLELTNLLSPPIANGIVYVPFAQEFWTAFLQGLRNLQGETSEKRRTREAKTVIGGITVIQELWSESETHRIGLICWEFGVDEEQKQSISVQEVILPGQEPSPTYEVSPTYFGTTENTPGPFISTTAPPTDFTGYPPPPTFQPTLLHSSPLAHYNSSSHLHPYAATLQRYSVSPMPTLEQATSPLIMRSASAPTGFNPSAPTFDNDIVDTGVVVPSMDPGSDGLGITGLGQEGAWLDYSAPRRVEAWNGNV